MINKMIRGFTRILGKPLDWKEEDHGKCGALAVLDLEEDVMGNGTISNSMISAWDPTPDEMRKLKFGAPVYLRVAGVAHPPVAIWVGDPPIDGMEPSFDDIKELKRQLVRRIHDMTDNLKQAEELAELFITTWRAGRVL